MGSKSKYIETVTILLGLVVSIFGIVNAFEYTIDELRSFESPLELQKQFPYNLSGVDNDGALVWTSDLGSWDFRGMVNEGGATLENFTRHAMQFFVRMRDSSLNGTMPIVLIGDYSGFDSRQALDVPTVTFMYRVFRFHNEKIGAEGYKKVYAMFVNPWFFPVYKIGKVFLGNFVDKVELHAANSKEGLDRILKHIAPDQIPSKYGGSKDHVPLKTF